MGSTFSLEDYCFQALMRVLLYFEIIRFTSKFIYPMFHCSFYVVFDVKKLVCGKHDEDVSFDNKSTEVVLSFLHVK